MISFERLEMKCMSNDLKFSIKEKFLVISLVGLTLISAPALGGCIESACKTGLAEYVYASLLFASVLLFTWRFNPMRMMLAYICKTC